MRRIISTAVFLLTAIIMAAGPVDRNDARAKATAFLASKGKAISNSESMPRLNLQSNGNNSQKEYFHIFNAENNGGYVIVSADDRTAPILGYTDQGEFCEAQMPENMRSWLQHYVDEMEWLNEHPQYAALNSSTEAELQGGPVHAQKPHHAIAPILTCLWNQGDPYNQMCPIYYNADGSEGDRSATGCVATAIAQVLYHHKFPAKTKSRIPAMASNGQTLKAITAGTSIDWEHMVDAYNGSETQEEKDAVAFLMLLVGQSLKMGYGASSGSSYAESRKLFVDHLGYDDGVQILRSDNFGITEWFEMIYEEIDKGYPVGYGGSSTGGGHAFVLDGFDGGDLFHVNWGWGGGSNGYFRMTVLNPGDNSGIGASSSADGYSMGQDAIMYLRAEDDGIEYNEEKNPHLSINDTRIDGRTKIFSNYVNWSGNSGTFNYAIMEKDADGNLVTVSDVRTVSLNVNTYIGATFDMQGLLTPGVHKLTPASKLTTKDKWIPLYDFRYECILANVDDNGNVALEKYIEPIGLEATHWAFPGSLKSGDQQNVNITLKNNGAEFKREVALYASKTNDKGNSVCRALIGVLAGDTDEFTFYFRPQETGTYNLWLTLNSDKNQVIGQTTVDIGNVAKNKASLAVSGVSMQAGGYGNFLKGTMTVKNNGSQDFAGMVDVQWWRDGKNGYWYGGSSQKLYYEIPAGSTATADFFFDNLQIGDTYRLRQGYTTQDGELSNGGIWDGDQWNLKAGALSWSKNGTVSGANVTSTYKAVASAAGIWFCQATPSTVTASSNANVIYCFDNGATIPTGLEGKNVVVGNEAEQINITDGSAAYFPRSFTAKNATFTYTVEKACDGQKGWVALTLPFAPESITVDGEEATWKHAGNDGKFWIKRFYEVNDAGEVEFCDAESLRDGTPYLVGFPAEMVGKNIVMTARDVKFTDTSNGKMVESTHDFQLYGTTYMPRINNVYVMNEEGTAFVFSESNRSGLDAFRDYFTTALDPAPSEIPLKFADDTNGIENVSSSSSSSIYDLQGRKVSGTQAKGIYIINGKKVVF